MGNCFRPRDPLEEILPRDTGIDASAVREADVPIICMVGGPGSGKETQAKKAADKFRLVSIMATDLLRDEVHTRSVRGVVLARYMSQGRLVPPDVLVELVKAKLLAKLNTARGFILIGFPREKDQGKLFEKQVKQIDLIIYLSARTSVLRDRVMAKAVTMNRELTYSTVRERLKVFFEAANPMLRHFKKKVVEIDAEEEEEIVFEDVSRAIEELLNKKQKQKAQAAAHTSHV